MKARERMAAEMKPMGTFWNGLGTSASSSFSRMPANMTMARMKPIAEKKEKTTEVTRSYSSWMEMRATPRMAQFVVMSGRKMPSEL